MDTRKVGFTVGLILSWAITLSATNAAAVVPESIPGPAIVTEDGPVQGLVFPDFHAFLGIPYAAPPSGERRWMPPQRHGRWHGVLRATQFGNICPQSSPTGFAGDEDCLYLNVFTPGLQRIRNKHESLPVMVWIHGGDLVQGAGSFYNPSPLVIKGNVIVVTINYRLGVLGFLAHPAIDAEGHDNGNYGLMDQQFALQWVQRNIAAFGGDPDRVTIFGESAGGLSVYSQLASPTAAGLFSGAIAQSGAYTSFQRYQRQILSLTDAEARGTTFATHVGCGQTAQCLRVIPASELIDAQPDGSFPILDGKVLALPPGQAFVSGQFNQVPVITGSNHDEGRLFVAKTFGSSLTDAAYSVVIKAILGLPLVTPVLQRYPLSAFPSPSAPLAVGAWFTDVRFACPGQQAARALAQHVQTYAYEFNDENAPLIPGVTPSVNFPLGSYHSAELQYLFKIRTGVAFNSDQRQLSDTMIAYWTRFAATGDPNLPGAPEWLPYDADTGTIQSLTPPLPSTSAAFDTDHQCSSFWDT